MIAGLLDSNCCCCCSSAGARRQRWVDDEVTAASEAGRLGYTNIYFASQNRVPST